MWELKFTFIKIYILVRSNISITGDNGHQAASKNYAPFTKCFTKIDRTMIDDTEDLGLALTICNLLEFSSNYSNTTGT